VVSDLILDSARSRVRIQTFAEGLFARLAHDLELSCTGLTGRATHDGADGGGGTGSAQLEGPLGEIRVTGVIRKDGSVDERALTPGERREIAAKMQSDVFHARPDATVRVEAAFEDGRARVRIHPPNGKGVEVFVEPEITREGAELRARGTFEVSLRSIGSSAIKAPMGAFRMKDHVRVSFDVVFRPG